MELRTLAGACRAISNAVSHNRSNSGMITSRKPKAGMATTRFVSEDGFFATLAGKYDSGQNNRPSR
jgi:hypothetical protein